MSGTRLDSVRRDVEARQKTDRIISSYWLLVPLAGVIFAISIFLYIGYLAYLSILSGSYSRNFGQPYLAVLAYIYPISLGLGILMAILKYRLITRRSLHFRREQVLFDDLLGALSAKAAEKNLVREFRDAVAPAHATLSEIKMKETPKEAIVWVVVAYFIGILDYFIFYFLMKDFYRHERREEQFLEQLMMASSSIGVVLQFQRRPRPLPNRSFALYFILTIFTVGIFWFYWLNKLIQDPNGHFRSQGSVEDSILTSLVTA